MQLVSIEAASKLPRLRVRIRAAAAAAPPCCGTMVACADRFFSMQTLPPHVRHGRAPWHGNCTKRSSQPSDSCGTMQPSAGGSRPCPRLHTLSHRLPSLAPPAFKRAAASRHSSAPTPAAQRTTRRCPFPVRCRLCRWRELCALGMRLPAWTATADTAAAHGCRGVRIGVCSGADRHNPCPPPPTHTVPHRPAPSHVACRIMDASARCMFSLHVHIVVASVTLNAERCMSCA